MESLQGLLQGDASLLPMLSALAADKAKRGGGTGRGGGGYDVHAVQLSGQAEQQQQQQQQEAMPSLLLQLFASLEQQQQRPGSGQHAQQGAGSPGSAGEEAGGGGEGVGERPSWIPSGLFGGQVGGTGATREVPVWVVTSGEAARSSGSAYQLPTASSHPSAPLLDSSSFPPPPPPHRMLPPRASSRARCP